ncbi:hypothetical protein D3C87_2160750 [compost metagenome]
MAGDRVCVTIGNHSGILCLTDCVDQPRHDRIWLGRDWCILLEHDGFAERDALQSDQIGLHVDVQEFARESLQAL